MTWWRRLLGLSPIESRHATPTPADTGAGPKRVTIEKHGGRIVSVRELDFTGQRATSPNGRFTLLRRLLAYALPRPVNGPGSVKGVCSG